MIFHNVLKGLSRNMRTHTCASCMRFTWRCFLLPGVVQQCLLESQPCGKHTTVEKNHTREGKKNKTVICIKWKCSRGKYKKTNERRQTICSSLCAAVSVTRSGLTVSDTDSKSFKKLLGMSHISSEQNQWKRKGEGGKKCLM